jgi:hypothetical protein
MTDALRRLRLRLLAAAVVGAFAMPVVAHDGPHEPEPTAEEQAGTLTNDLVRSLRALENASPNARLRAEQQLQQALAKRAAVLYSLVEKNPRLVMLKALPGPLRDKVPESMRGSLEQEVDATGVLVGRVADDFAAGRAKQHFFLEVPANGGTRRLNVDIADPRMKKDDLLQLVGKRVTVRGLLLVDHLLVGDRKDLQLAAADGSTTTTTSTTPTMTAVVTGDQPTLVIMANFSDKANACTPSGLASGMFTSTGSVNALYRETSRNLVSFSGQVVGPFSINYSAGGSCDYTGWGQALDAAATAAGISLSQYKRVTYAVPQNPNCGWAGLAYVGGSRSWVNTCSAGVFAHELGHNLRFHHAATPTAEYGDGSDPLGGARMVQFNAANRVMAGWQPTGTVQDVVGTASFTLTSLSLTGATSPQVLRLRKADTNEFYYVSMRSAHGFDATNLASGYKGLVAVHRSTGTLPAKTFLLAQLAAGQSFTDAANGLQITASTVDAANGGATVAVAMNTPACTQSAPTLTVSPTTQTGSPGQSLSYGLTVTNRNGSTCTSSTFSLAQSLPSGFAGGFSPASVTLAPGASASVTWSVASGSTQSDGSYLLKATVADSAAAGNTGSVDATYVVYRDTTAPTVSLTSPSNGAVLKRGNIGLSAAASDSGGVARVEFYANGVLVGSDTSAPYAVNWNARKAKAGAYTLSARAIDRAGNPSLAATVNVTLQ